MRRRRFGLFVSSSLDIGANNTPKLVNITFGNACATHDALLLDIKLRHRQIRKVQGFIILFTGCQVRGHYHRV